MNLSVSKREPKAKRNEPQFFMQDSCCFFLTPADLQSFATQSTYFCPPLALVHTVTIHQVYPVKFNKISAYVDKFQELLNVSNSKI